MRPALLRPMRKTMTPSELPIWGQCSQPAGWQVLCRVSSESLPSCQVSHVAPCGIMRGEVDMGGHTLGCIRPREVIGDPASTRSRAPLEVRKGSPISPTASELLRRVRNLLPSCRQLVGGILVSKLACWCCAATLGPTCTGQAQRSQVLATTGAIQWQAPVSNLSVGNKQQPMHARAATITSVKYTAVSAAAGRPHE